MTDQIQDQDVVLDENEIEEAHDPKNAEEASIASVKAAEGKSPKAKKLIAISTTLLKLG